MVELWFAILCLMLVIFTVLGGWDFGAGALHFVAARNQEQRRMLIAAIGPLWTWNEVWLVASGGVLFVAFPRVLAISFPAYYLALFLVLWALILRGIALEVRGLIDSGLWRAFWDTGFAAANISLAILFGAAIGNVVRGMPLQADVPLSLPLFTNFGVRGPLGILDWYTVSVAVFTLVCLCAHGASYLALKAEGEVYRRARMLTKWLWPAAVVLLVAVSVETFYVRPEMFTNMAGRPLAWIALVLTVGRNGSHAQRPPRRCRRANILGRMLLHRGIDGQRGCKPFSGDPLFDCVRAIFDHRVQRLVRREQSAGSELLVAGGVRAELRLLLDRREALPRPRTSVPIWARSTIEGCLSPIR